MITKELQQKLDIYEQLYNGLDEPIPFKDGLYLYPVLVKDYYKFHRCIGCLTRNKNVKMVPDAGGLKMKEVANIKGLKSSYQKYLIELMTDPVEGREVTAQLMDLFELVFRMKRGRYCPECGKEVSYEEIVKDIEVDINAKYESLYAELKAQLEEHGFSEKQITEDVIAGMRKQSYGFVLTERSKCPACGKDTREIFSIKDVGDSKVISVRGIDITDAEFDELKAIVPRQNIVDYDDDVYVNPELKKELEEKKRLQNMGRDYTSPSLEKQLVCVAVDTGFSLEYLKNITMRKLTLFLRLVDKKHTYYAQYQAKMSGMVEFKHEPEHWIFSDDKPNIAKELTDSKDFEDKFKFVT